MANAKKDQNYVNSLIAVSTADGETPVRLEADPVTGNLQVDASISLSASDIEIGAVELKNATTDDRVAVINSDPTTEFGMVTRNIPSGTQLVEIATNQADVFDTIAAGIQAIATTRGTAADLRMTILSGVVTTVSTVTTVTTLTGITNIGGIPAVGLVPSNQNTAAVLSNINNVV